MEKEILDTFSTLEAHDRAVSDQFKLLHSNSQKMKTVDQDLALLQKHLNDDGQLSDKEVEELKPRFASEVLTALRTGGLNEAEKEYLEETGILSKDFTQKLEDANITDQEKWDMFISEVKDLKKSAGLIVKMLQQTLDERKALPAEMFPEDLNTGEEAKKKAIRREV